MSVAASPNHAVKVLMLTAPTCWVCDSELPRVECLELSRLNPKLLSTVTTECVNVAASHIHAVKVLLLTPPTCDVPMLLSIVTTCCLNVTVNYTYCVIPLLLSCVIT